MAKHEAPNKTHNNPTTGHEWDGIEEYNNPLPRWWVWVFLLCVLFSLGYVIYYPAFPGNKWGMSDWTSLKRLNDQMTEGQAGKQAMDDTLASTDLHAVPPNADLHTYAKAAGKALFAMHCSQCHGSGGAGVKGYPNLLDDEWLFGGSLSDIAFTITHGVRNTTDADARNLGPMLAFGRDEVLTPDQIKDVSNYLSTLAYGYAGNESTARGEAVFLENCTICHGNGGVGNRELGAPPLNNGIWQYGSKAEDRMDVITNGRAGVMPAWGQKLTPTDIKKLALYVHSLGGGEAEKAPEPVVEPSPTSVIAPVAEQAPQHITPPPVMETPAEAPVPTAPAVP